MVTAQVTDAMIAERHRLGLDRRDEVWEGVYHVVPPANSEHQRLEFELVMLLGPLARQLGLVFRFEMGVIAPGVADWSDFKVPDLLIASPESVSERGVEGRAELVIEIRSPGDETFDKIDWYGRAGTQELLVIDRDTKQVRHWGFPGGQPAETGPDPDGWVSCQGLPFRVRTTPTGALEVETSAGSVTI